MENKEWTIEEALLQIGKFSAVINGETYYDLEGIKEVIFDPRFPQDKLGKAIEFLKLADSVKKDDCIKL